jgi:hypothetical protein
LRQIKSDEELNSQLKYLESEIYKIYKKEFLSDSIAPAEKGKSGIEILKEMEKALEE